MTRAAPEPAAARSWIRRPMIMLAAGVALAAAAAGVIVTSTGHGTPRPRSSVHLTYAAEVLDKAAKTAAAAGVTLHPRPDQWIYEKYVQRGNSSDDPNAVYTNEAWARFDGRQDAHYVKGKLVLRPTPAGLHGTLEAAYAAINSLPPDPKALLAVIYRRVDATPRGQWAVGTRDAEAFNTLDNDDGLAAGGAPADRGGVVPRHGTDSRRQCGRQRRRQAGRPRDQGDQRRFRRFPAGSAHLSAHRRHLRYPGLPLPV